MMCRSIPAATPLRRKRSAVCMRASLPPWPSAIAINIEATGIALAKIRRQLRDEMQAAICKLRAELQVKAAVARADVIDLPAIPLRRRSSAA
jgi:hypothetical protein